MTDCASFVAVLPGSRICSTPAVSAAKASEPVASVMRLPGDPAFDVQKGDARVIIRLTTGESFTSYVDVIRGSPEDPFTMDDLRRRFLDQASSVLPEDKLAVAADYIEKIQEVDDIGELTGQLVG